MAESVSIKGRVKLLCCSILLLASSSAIQAQENLPDPTRPPAGMGASAPAASGPVLQSVLISPGRKLAVISGETVQVGDRFGEARVTRIAEGEVVLIRGEKSQTLRLFPGIEKRQAKGGRPVRESGRRH